MFEIVVACALGLSPLATLGIVRFVYSLANYAQRVGDESEYY